jgi:type IX secretion system PorP/SprF family membrane protein
MKKHILTLLTIATSYLSNAQDAEFSQFYSAPLYLNPAYAGTDSSARLGFNYRYQWPDMPGKFTTYCLAYDQYVKALHGGLGVVAWYDDAASGTMKTENISGIYSFQLNVTNDFTINAGFEAAYMHKSLDWSKITFGDQIDPRYGFVFTGQNIQNKSSNQYVDLSAGILGYTKEFYGGVAVDHLTQPNEGFALLPTPIPMKITANFGAMIPLNESGRNQTFISPNFIVQFQQSFQQYNLGLDLEYGIMTAGCWYRFSPTNGDAIITMLGLKAWRFKVAYSYDITVSGLANYSGGAHEISLAYLFRSKKGLTTTRRINSPSF